MFVKIIVFPKADDCEFCQLTISLMSKPIFSMHSVTNLTEQFSSTSSSKPVILAFWQREYCSFSFAFTATFAMVSSTMHFLDSLCNYISWEDNYTVV